MAASKLNSLSINRLGPGNHGDGQGGLYLRVAGNSRTWAFRYKKGTNKSGKPATHWVSLGRTADFTLAEARQRARECRRQLFDGIDVKSALKASRAGSPDAKTFDEVATEYIDAHKAGWKNEKHGQQWRNTIDQHAKALLTLKVNAITVDDVLPVLKEIWAAKTETASRLRGRIEAVLDYATAQKWRTGDNPARWKGHLEALLPARSKVAAVEHHAAMGWKDVPSIIPRLAASKGTAARCLSFLILTAARSGEARGAKWSEIDLAEKIWTVPSARMKAKREHRVPLTDEAIAILREMAPAKARPDALVFPGGKAGAPLSDVALNKALRTAGATDVTVHGFRSSFRDWCGEAVSVPREVAEAALAHVNKDRVEAAYARSDLFERRRTLMEQWAAHCLKGAAG